MQIPPKLKETLEKLGLNEEIYAQRTRKCIIAKDYENIKNPEKVPWFSQACFIPEDYEIKDSFVFDPVSIVPCIALEPRKEDRILDMCAAPGTKTFILSYMTDNDSRIAANDIDKNRVKRLKSIVNRNHLSVEVTNMSGRKLAGSFDKILLDAPCSGEGMVNKKEKLFRNWSEKRVKILSKKQKKLIAHAFSLLHPGGLLVYSTCTFEPDENEAVVDFLLSGHDNAVLEYIEANIVHENGLTEWIGTKFHPDMAKCMRIYPSQNRTTGFFVARIRKKD